MEQAAPEDRFRQPDEPGAVELRAFTHGLQPATVPAMMEHFTEDWRRFGVDAWNWVPNHWRPESPDEVGWWTLPSYLGDHFIAPLLGAPTGTCILQPNVHWTMQCLLSAPEVARRGTEVVVPETAFLSVLHSAKQWSHLRDLTPRVVSTPDDRLDPGALLDAVGPDTALVAVSHVGFSTGARVRDSVLRTIADHVHDQNGLFLIDGYHAAGTMPLNVKALECDVYVGGLLKEGCGGSGSAFLYVRDGLDLTPRLTGWFGEAAPFEFRPTPTPHEEVRRRFLGGTMAVAPMYHAVEGVRILLEFGLESVRNHSLALTRQAIEHANAIGLSPRSPTEPDRRSAMVVLEIPEAQKMTTHLKTHHIYTDSRNNEVIRLAPFLWNTPAEIERTFEEIEDALATDTYLDATSETTGPVP